MAENTLKRKRIYIAAVKLLAIFLVVFIHTKQKGYWLYEVSSHSPFFMLYLFLSIASRIAVPLYFMCSGAVLLGRDEPLSTLYRHRILRYVVVLVVVSFAYYLLAIWGNLGRFRFDRFLAILYSDKLTAHLWFLYAYLACLLVLPFLRKLARSLEGREIAYMIVLQVVFTSLIPAVEYLLGRNAVVINKSFRPNHVVIGAFYMLMGYWMEAKMDFSRIRKKHIVVGVLAAVLAVAASCALTMFKANVTGGFGGRIFHESFIAIPTLVVFGLFRIWFERMEITESVSRALLYAGDLTFGIYLMHMATFRLTTKIDNLIRPWLTPLIATILWVLLTVIVSGAVTAALRKIPFVKKYL